MVFIESQAFTRQLHRLTKAQWSEVLSAIQSDLLENPECGDLVKGLGRIRKARAADPSRGKGKRGGFRYLFLGVPARAHIHLLYLFGKDEQEDLESAERDVLRQMAEQIKNQGRRP